MTPDPALLTAQEACRYLRCGETYLRAHAEEIGVVRKGRSVGYRQCDLDAWLASRVVKTAPASAPTPLPVRSRTPRRDWVTTLRTSDAINPVTRRPFREVAR